MVRLRDKATAVLVPYTGISFPFRFGPTGKVETSTTGPAEIQHIVESVQQIITTRQGNRRFPGERVIIRGFGAQVVDLLFEPMNDALMDLIEGLVHVALAGWEKRVEMRRVEILEFDPVESKVVVEMDIFVRKMQRLVTVQTDLG